MLEERSQETEIMDDLNISGQVVDQTLAELDVINKRLGGNSISLRAFRRLVANHDKLLVADLGCGGGDIMVSMANWCQKKHRNVQFMGIDANPNIIKYAEANTKDYSEIRYQSLDIFSESFASLQFDIIHCCLFLHHFTDDQLVKLFKLFQRQAHVGIIVNDLHRHPFAYYSIKWLTSLFSRSEMVKNDAAISVARGFKKKEWIAILKKAGISNYSIKWRWAFRWELIINASHQK